MEKTSALTINIACRWRSMSVGSFDDLGGLNEPIGVCLAHLPSLAAVALERAEILPTRISSNIACFSLLVAPKKQRLMLRTITVVLMTNPSRWLAFYFRPRDGEHCDRVFNRCPDILTWTHCETLQIAAYLVTGKQ
jgi:hypothetical protein